MSSFPGEAPLSAKALLWRSREAAAALAISERKLWDLTNRNLIPHVRIGRAVRYSPADLLAWIEAQKSGVPANSGDIADDHA
jgi:excisionase family DNA binding protein